MANLKMEPVWTFQVSQPEMRLILNALGGRLHSKELQQADDLCDKLTRMRINQVRDLIIQIDGLEASLNSK